MSQQKRKKNYFDLQDAGGKVLRKIAYLIVCSEYYFKIALSSELKRPIYSINRYMDRLTRELLLDNFDELEEAIMNVLKKCSNGSISVEINSEKVMRRRERFEEGFLRELRELHEKAVQRSIA